ncbi:MAG: biotin--[acetyl-CoA-carboxylase] ligase [Cytophaga sp.]|uniref:biotin--[acetyl-CoA-carboxylase] ligase n=1 Tax=Cytophaga sp. TaxID=29535 RepID=UPI003F7F2E14
MYNNLANTKFTGKSIHFLPSCHSTNTEASLLIRSKSAVNGLIVITNEQTAGRGQQGNSWHSEPQANLTFSLILYPEYLRIADSFFLNIVASLAIAKTLQHFLSEKKISVKWPNDIYIGNKKVCGILIENSLRGEQIHSIVMGIGLNVNQASFPLPTATSMVQEAGHAFSLQQILDYLCESIETYYLMLAAGSKKELSALYQERLYAFNTLHAYQDAQGDFMGYIKGVEENGTLVIEKESGTVSRYQFKEVRFM